MSVFLTLTYSEKKLPISGSLIKKDYQQFLKRLRLAIHPVKCRYYLVGEYGDIGGRPHYHCVLFGYGEGVRPGVISERTLSICTEEEKELFRLWGFGNVHVGSVTEASLQYACKHLVKGLKNDVADGCPVKLPEFARMSLRPHGLGFGALDEFERAFCGSSKGALAVYLLGGDAPAGIRLENKILPIGRYLRKGLRARLGLDERTACESRKRLSLEAAERAVALGPAGLKKLRAVDAHKAELALLTQKSRSKL